MSKLKKMLKSVIGKTKKRAAASSGTTRQLTAAEIAAINRNMAAGGTRTPGRGGYPNTLLGGRRERLL